MYLMTMTDSVSCWFKVATIRHGSLDSYECDHIFDDVWYTLYLMCLFLEIVVVVLLTLRVSIHCVPNIFAFEKIF